jgi:hypothetical protein
MKSSFIQFLIFLAVEQQTVLPRLVIPSTESVRGGPDRNPVRQCSCLGPVLGDGLRLLSFPLWGSGEELSRLNVNKQRLIAEREIVFKQYSTAKWYWW